MFSFTDEPEVQTVAITNKRGSGKSLTLAWAGYAYKEKDVPVSSNMAKMMPVAEEAVSICPSLPPGRRKRVGISPKT